MARSPQRRSLGQRWTDLIFGPEHFKLKVSIILVAFCVIAPGYAVAAFTTVLGVLIQTFGPSAGPLLSIAIAVGGIWLMFRAIVPKKKKGKEKH